MTTCLNNVHKFPYTSHSKLEKFLQIGLKLKLCQYITCPCFIYLQSFMNPYSTCYFPLVNVGERFLGLTFFL